MLVPRGSLGQNTSVCWYVEMSSADPSVGHEGESRNVTSTSKDMPSADEKWDQDHMTFVLTFKR